MSDWETYKRTVKKELEGKPPTRKRTMKMAKEEEPKPIGLDEKFMRCQQNLPDDSLRIVQMMASQKLKCNDVEVSEYLFFVQQMCLVVLSNRTSDPQIVGDKQFAAIKRLLTEIYDTLSHLWMENPTSIEWETRIDLRRTIATVLFVVQREMPFITYTTPPRGIEMLPTKSNIKECSMREMIALCQHVIYKWFSVEANTVLWNYSDSLCIRLNEFVAVHPKKNDVMNHFSYIEEAQGYVQANQDFYTFLHAYSFETATIARKHSLVMDNLKVEMVPLVSDEKRSKYWSWLMGFAEDDLADSVLEITKNRYFKFHLPPGALTMYVERLMETKQLDDHPTVIMDDDFCTGAFATIHSTDLKTIQNKVFFSKPLDVLKNAELATDPVCGPVVRFMHMCFFHMAFRAFVGKQFLEDHLFRNPHYQQLSRNEVMIGMFCCEYYISCSKMRITLCTNDIVTAIHTFLDMFCLYYNPPIENFNDLKADMFDRGKFHRKPSVNQHDIYKNLDARMIALTTK